ncbi:hypothetical protein RIF29_15085 [Crotalaria pallida]|uniref:Uncharacterized protein n=1 Tax=Crotalaria pallida TaxID=3830 RepID=A0AAN9IEC0_CROPI
MKILFISSVDSFYLLPIFDALDTVNLQRESYRFRVRVVRKWYLPGFMNPEQPMSMELILMDDAGLDGDEYPPIFKGLVGRKLLFNVANPVSGSSADTGSIKVRGVCDEPHIISAFESANSGIPAEEVIPLSVVPPVVDLSSDHSEDIGDANILTSAALGEPNYTCSFNSPPSTPPVSAVLQTPPTTLKKKFDNLFADDTPPIHVARKRVNKAVKK